MSTVPQNLEKEGSWLTGLSKHLKGQLGPPVNHKKSLSAYSRPVFLPLVSWEPRETPKVITFSRGPVGFQPTIFWEVQKKWFSDCLERFKQRYPIRADRLRREARCWEDPKMYLLELYPGPIIPPTRPCRLWADYGLVWENALCKVSSLWEKYSVGSFTCDIWVAVGWPWFWLAVPKHVRSHQGALEDYIGESDRDDDWWDWCLESTFDCSQITNNW